MGFGIDSKLDALRSSRLLEKLNRPGGRRYEAAIHNITVTPASWPVLLRFMKFFSIHLVNQIGRAFTLFGTSVVSAYFTDTSALAKLIEGLVLGQCFG